MPFPSSQGTQVLVREQCEALTNRGHDVHLLVYAHGAFDYKPPYTIHRLGDWPHERALRSGPSWRKAILDLLLVREVRRLATEVGPDLVHAHNYEALVACLAARPTAPLVYHAHTLFGHELPTFANGLSSRMLARATGYIVDRTLPRRAEMTLAVSPLLVEELVACGHPAERIECSLPGIDVPDIEADREAQRQSVGLQGQNEVIGYCGNLDGYQGLDTSLGALSLLAPKRPKLMFLVITASSTEPLLDRARALGVRDRVRCVEHGEFSKALELVGAADVCVVSRFTPGGFPIKLLTYLAAGRPVVTTRAGAAGLEIGGLSVVADRDQRAMAEALEWLLDHPGEASSRGSLGRELVLRDFSWEVAGEGLEAKIRKVLPQQAD